MGRLIAWILFLCFLCTPCCLVYNEPATGLEGVIYIITGIGDVLSDIGNACVQAVVNLTEEQKERITLWWEDLTDFGGQEETEAPESGGLPQTGGEAPESGGLPQTGGEAPEESSWWEKTFRCDHSPKSYDKKVLTVTCKCGLYTYDDMLFEEFQDHVPQRFPIPRSKGKQLAYATKEYHKYLAANRGIDPDMAAFALNLGLLEGENEGKQKLMDMTAVLAGAATTTSSVAEIAESFTAASYMTSHFCSNVKGFFGAASYVLTAVKVGSDLENLSKPVNNPMDESQRVEYVVDFFKDVTSVIPVGGVAFGKALDAVKAGLKTVMKGKEAALVRDTVLWSTATNGALARLESAGNLLNKKDWENGPSFHELAGISLTAEEVYGLAPYLEFRADMEIREIYGMSLKELIEAYEKIR